MHARPGGLAQRQRQRRQRQQRQQRQQQQRQQQQKQQRQQQQQQRQQRQQQRQQRQQQQQRSSSVWTENYIRSGKSLVLRGCPAAGVGELVGLADVGGLPPCIWIKIHRRSPHRSVLHSLHVLHRTARSGSNNSNSNHSDDPLYLPM